MAIQPNQFFVRWLGCAVSLALLGLLFHSESAEAQQKASKPIKLAVHSNAKSYRVGATAEIEVVIQDANNQAVKAEKEVIVEIEVHLRAGKMRKMQDTIKAGASSKKFRLPLDEVGSIEIRARHLAKPSELREGGTFIFVTPAPRVRLRPGAMMPGFNWWFAGSPMMPQIPYTASPSSSGRDSLDLKSSPQRTLLADGKDAATIHLFLYANNEEGTATNDIRVRLFNSGGRLEPTIVKIPKGDDYGEATLTSNQVGLIKVQYLGATPVVQPPKEKELQIQFGPPITQIDLNISPPAISLVDNANLIVQLLDENGTPMKTDEPRTITFAIEQGRGEIQDKEISIPAGRADGMTTFQPTWMGKVSISASTPNLRIVTRDLQVTLPTWPLILSALGGLIGGVIAFWTRQGSKWWRIIIGLVTGFVLYWAFVFGVLTVIPRTIVLNPLSAFVLSTLGGWLGTEVFAQILKRFGLAT
ncbi:MAG: DUF1129 domain-containing protein [candidate division KSB1 bacterium]|nr:DUF1129 domain-containing protein [candidate division KSB1 bacterium]MDZ7301542.1 DUF1129 domain-containing protein [candidate division KSB1 bacterium]MDZ7311042.1 DUF1129 domain-containing protein [candidate division KSB1 bacterium]